MGIYARGKFWWKYYDKDPQTGRSPLKPASTKILVDAPTPQQRKQNKIDAEAQYQDDLRRLREGERGGPRLKPIAWLPFATWYLQTISPTHRSQQTAITDRCAVDVFTAFFGAALPLTSITPKLVKDWMADRLKHVKAATVNRELSILRTMLREAIASGYLASHPLQDATGEPLVRQLDIAEIEARYFTRDEFAKFIGAIERAPRVHHVPRATGIALAYCALDTLLRMGSLISLTWQADKGTHFHVLNTKTEKLHKARISRRMRAALDAIRPRHAKPTDRIFQPFFDRQRVHAGDAQKSACQVVGYWFTAACKLARVASSRKDHGLTFHSFRHTGATWLLESGFDVRTVQQIGGWSTLEQLERYGHTSDDRIAAATESLGDSRIVAMRAARA